MTASDKLPELTPELLALWEEFIGWDLTDAGTRAALRLPTSKAAWARAHGRNERTVRRWADDPRYTDLHSRMSAAGATGTLALGTGSAGVSGVPEASGAPETRVVSGFPVPDTDELALAGLTGDEADYQRAKSAVVTGAAKGDPKMLDLYFRTYGKTFVEEEAAARKSDLTGEDFDDLVAKALAAVDVTVLTDVLAAAGWSVRPPEPTDG